MAKSKWLLHVTKGYRKAPDVRCKPGQGRRHEAKERARTALIKNRRQEPQRTINAMTNHERNLWARAGYPKGQKFKVYAAAANERLRIAKARKAA